ncbi:FUSC family protein [Actinoplanes siamensis]|uniref:FUSC family protein n=1 Tax=Actinoplanes siamensis TaxID=1223317 RepID=UPI0019436D43|nr:FUSC family protein [Actinoplanes siamensis]
MKIFRKVSHPMPAALRAGVSVAVPLLVVLVADRPEWSMYAAFGAFTSLYGRTRSGRPRLIMQAGAAAALITAVLLGVLVGSLAERNWPAVAVVGLVAAAGTAIATAEQWHPPGALFLTFAFGAVASAPHHLADVPAAAGVASASAAFSLLVGSLRGRRPAGGRTGRPPVERGDAEPGRVWHRLRAVDVREAVWCGVAASVAGIVATGLGIGHPYWATVAAVAPLSVAGRSARLLRAGHRIGGTLVGLVAAAGVLALGLGPYPAILALAVLQIGAELVVGRHYGLAMVFITPLALLMNQMAAPRAISELLWDRGVETAVGAAVACAVILLAAPRARGPAPRRVGEGPGSR